jgi:hypothetical protein
MIIRHYSDAPWDPDRWPNFTPQELSCRHCGELYWWPEAFDAIQAVRQDLGQPVKIFSGHRCLIHNANVGGAPLSMHKRIAFDVALAGHDLENLLRACRQAGFAGTGFYQTFLHVDLGNRRRWWGGEGARKLWTGLA